MKTVLIIYLISFLLSLKIREVEEPNKKKTRLRNRRKNPWQNENGYGKDEGKGGAEGERGIYSESTNTLEEFARAVEASRNLCQKQNRNDCSKINCCHIYNKKEPIYSTN